MSANTSEEELKQKIHDITQTMLIALSEWQAGAPVNYEGEKIKGRLELFELFKDYQLKDRAERDAFIGTQAQREMAEGLSFTRNLMRDLPNRDRVTQEFLDNFLPSNTTNKENIDANNN